MGKAKAPKQSRECFYCGTDTDNGERDHFPKPKKAGGTNVVWACRFCHNAKDRYRLLDLAGPVFQAPMDEWISQDPSVVIVLAACTPRGLPAEWPWIQDPTIELMVLFDQAPNAMSRVYVARVMRLWWTLIAEGRAVCRDDDDRVVDRRAEWCGIEAAA